MARPKKEVWISGKQAAAILTKNSGREIAQAYVRLLALKGKIAARVVDGRTSEYRLADIEGYRVQPRERGKGRGKLGKIAASVATTPPPVASRPSKQAENS